MGQVWRVEEELWVVVVGQVKLQHHGVTAEVYVLQPRLTLRVWIPQQQLPPLVVVVVVVVARQVEVGVAERERVPVRI